MKDGGTSRQWEVVVARQEDKRRRWRIVKTTGGGGCGAIRGDARTSIGTLDGGYSRKVPLPRAPRLQRAALAEKCTATFFPSKCTGTFWNHE